MNLRITKMDLLKFKSVSHVTVYFYHLHAYLPYKMIDLLIMKVITKLY